MSKLTSFILSFVVGFAAAAAVDTAVNPPVDCGYFTFLCEGEVNVTEE